MNSTHNSTLCISPIATSSPVSTVVQQYDNDSTDMPMTITQAIQISSPSNLYYQPQANVIIAEYSFFYKAYNDFQIYHITCKEISFETASRLLSNRDHSAQSSNFYLHVFYYQQPDDKKIYQVICEIVSYAFIVGSLNKTNYGIELNFNDQGNFDFSREHKENLEFYLKQDLIIWLAPISNGICSFDAGLVNTSQQHIADSNDFDQPSFQQGNNNYHAVENIYQP